MKTDYKKVVEELIEVLNNAGLLKGQETAQEEPADREPVVGDSVITNANYDANEEFNATITKIAKGKFTIQFEDGSTDVVERESFDLAEISEDAGQEDSQGYTQEELDAMTDEEIAEVATANEIEPAPEFAGKGAKRRLTNRDEIIAVILGDSTETPADEDEGFGEGEETPAAEETIIEPPTVEMLKSKKIKRADIEEFFTAFSIPFDKKESLDDLIAQCLSLSLLSKYDGDVTQITIAEKKLVVPAQVNKLAEKLGLKPSQKISETLTSIYNALQ